ncbi:CDP-glycerol glycerophosphotransferase family protein [Streptomyces sp. KK5PA1]|uniref:CDP-glycerol glycerophosphotransferase family protein n=2 Tax=Actinacidiphila acididurans TaxID=2784346 RepID=A0ABS2TWS0_9ACTN|nr:bifunctional glycosyltransferase/CDP-glycerol:glycerophosphate glycerophosphotransferase [Actinacidiphila acididurans]MBM9507793.1 CDP-glycerol glycerophosphotransferase family protein [Actinacidiphila acididurans]
MNRVPGPDLSVVVIVYNDAELLPTAVQSVLDQSLRSVEVVIVDDCSTDGSYEVAQALAELHPDRVRAFQLEQNSGGCGGPRNRGIAEVRGEYVVFLDSDDTLQHDACRNFLDAARATGADLVSGLTKRVQVRTGKSADWYPWLYTSTRTFESVGELPDLLVYDTLSTNMCYRRDFLRDNGLEFPVGIHYEDLLFSAQAYLAARRITLIPNHVYNWMVDDTGTRRSISNRRHEVENFVHRVRIHRQIDAIFRERGLDDLKLHKDTKFLKHDLVLHLRDLPFLDDDYRTQFSRLAREYMSRISQEAYERLEPIHRICAYLLMEEDWANLNPAIDTLINRQKLSVPLTERDGRVYWCAEHLDDERARAILDVTDLGYHAKPLRQMTLRAKLEQYRQTGQGIAVSGTVVNPLGRITEQAELKAAIELRPRRKGMRGITFPAAEVRHAGDHLTWRAEADLSKKLRPLGLLDPVWDIRLVLSIDGTPTVPMLITVGDAALETELPLRIRPRLSRLVADTLEVETSAKGHLAFVQVAQGSVSRRSRAGLDRALQGAPGTVAKNGLRRARGARKYVRSGETKIRVYHEVFSKLPVRKGTVVFESHLGKQYSDSPRAIYEEMRRQGVKFTAIWSYADRPEDFPADATLVKRWSFPYLRALAQAEFWIDNQGFPLKLTKRPETTYIQTWHGSALKKMGFDSPQLRVRTKDQQADYQRVLDRFDHFLIRSEHDARTLVPAFRLKDEVVLRSGYPRNDALVAALDAERKGGGRVRPDIVRELGIPEDRTILLYAPTFRNTAAGGVRKFEPPLDFDEFADRFGDRYTLLVRSHYLNTVVLPPSVRGRVIDVTSVHDVTPLFLAADAMITDYSSVMFDYALLDRPMVFFAYDYDEYVKDDRGTYFDLTKHAPGPVVRDVEGLYSVLDDLPRSESEWAVRRKQFVAEFGEYDKGDAARQIVSRFFRPGGSK